MGCKKFMCKKFMYFFCLLPYENGDPNSGWAGKFRVSVDFPQRHPVQGILANSLWGLGLGNLGAICTGEIRMARVDDDDDDDDDE